MGVSSVLSAKALGLSVWVFEQTYLSNFNEEDIAAIDRRMV